jgi:flagellar biosynthesis anti-sigma factor FlgM
MSDTGYEAADNARQASSAPPGAQGRGRKPSSRKAKRTTVSRKPASSREQQLQQLRKAVDDVPGIREDRIAAAKHALQTGTLELRGEKLAEKLLHDFLQKPNPEA